MGNMSLLLPVFYIWSLLYYSRCEVSDPCTKALNDTLFCTSIPDVTLYSPKLKFLIFKIASGIGTINNAMFNSSNLFSVTKLTMVSSNIRHIERGAFNSFLSLTALKLESNSLTTINASWFSSTTSLRTLSLAKNRIRAIERDALSLFFNLVELDLSDNEIRTIADSSFEGNLQLAVLDLSNNNLTFLRAEAFTGPKPQKVSLYSNPWNCFCELADLGSFLKGLMDKSVLVNGYSVTCNDPSSLKGIPVWNVTDFHCSITTSMTLPDQNTAPPTPILLPTLLGLLGLLFMLLLLVFLLVRKKQEKEQISPGSQETAKQGKGPQQPAAKENLSEHQSKPNTEIDPNSMLDLAVHKKQETAKFVPVNLLGVQPEGEHALKTAANCDREIPNSTPVPIGPSLPEDREGGTNRRIPKTQSDQEMEKVDGTSAQESSDPLVDTFEEHSTIALRSKLTSNSKTLDKSFLQKPGVCDVMKQQDRTGTSKPVGMILPLSKLMSGNDTTNPESSSAVPGSIGDPQRGPLRTEKLSQDEASNEHDLNTGLTNCLTEGEHSKEALKREENQGNIAYFKREVTGNQGAELSVKIGKNEDFAAEINPTSLTRGNTSTTRRGMKGQPDHEAALFPGTRCDSAMPSAPNSERTMRTRYPIKGEPPWNSEYGYVNLLHEIVENQGRRTRERWKQTHRYKILHKEQHLSEHG